MEPKGSLGSCKVDFETIERGHGIFKRPSELYLDVRYKHIIQSTIRQWLIDSQPELEDNQRLISIIDSKLEIEFYLADIRQDSGKYDVAEKVLQLDADIQGQKWPSIDMSTVISLQ